MLRVIVVLIALVALAEIWEGSAGPLLIVLLLVLVVWVVAIQHRGATSSQKRRGVDSDKQPGPIRERPSPSRIDFAGPNEGDKRMSKTESPIPLTPRDFANLVDQSVLRRSGSVFYSGRSAFSKRSDLYILGLNPGGSPITQSDETVERDLHDWLDELPEHWSAYADESWQGKSAGTHGMQPRVLHLFKQRAAIPETCRRAM